MQKEVKIINVTAERFGIFKALEIDLTQFQKGVIAFKGNAGQGKSTAQNAIKLGTQGRATLADAQQYGDDWKTETQLIDGDKKIFIGGSVKNGKIEYKLYEKDANGKKVQNPIIDGVKATPAKYMELISTELTFGIRKFLSENNTEHKKFMFDLFRPELEKLGVIFDKKHSGYKQSILGELDDLTAERDTLRVRCQATGAFVTSFEQDGYKLDSLDAMRPIDIEELNTEKNNLLVKKGQAEGNASVEHQKAISAVTEKGQKLVEQAREINTVLSNRHQLAFDKYEKIVEASNLELNILHRIKDDFKNLECIKSSDPNKLFGLKRDLNTFISSLDQAHADFFKIPERPELPLTLPIANGKISPETGVKYHPEFDLILSQRLELGAEFMAIKEPTVNLAEYDNAITSIEARIESAKNNNDLIKRYKLNREWVEADGQVTKKRQELAHLYAQINTGVEGLRMKPFFDEDGKMDIKTVYNGCYDYDFFKPKTKALAIEADKTDNASRKESIGMEIATIMEEDYYLNAYSSTQKPLIGVLLQVARLKLKSKVLPYIFLDDVPMDSYSRKLITKIAQDNNLNIITSLTGDYDKDKLTENELLIEGGEVFFK